MVNDNNLYHLHVQYIDQYYLIENLVVYHHHLTHLLDYYVCFMATHTRSY